jgi:hypothetical protein
VLHLKCILFFIKTEFPYQGCYDCAYNGCDESGSNFLPEAGHGHAADHEGTDGLAGRRRVCFLRATGTGALPPFFLPGVNPGGQKGQETEEVKISSAGPGRSKAPLH